MYSLVESHNEYYNITVSNSAFYGENDKKTIDGKQKNRVSIS